MIAELLNQGRHAVPLRKGDTWHQDSGHALALAVLQEFVPIGSEWGKVDMAMTVN